MSKYSRAIWKTGGKRPNWDNLWERVDLRIMTSYLRFVLLSNDNKNLISLFEWILSLATLGLSGISRCPEMVSFWPHRLDNTLFKVVDQISKYRKCSLDLSIFPVHTPGPLLSFSILFFSPTSTALIFHIRHSSLFQPHLGNSHCLDSPLAEVKNSLTYVSLFFVLMF